MKKLLISFICLTLVFTSAFPSYAIDLMQDSVKYNVSAARVTDTSVTVTLNGADFGFTYKTGITEAEAIRLTLYDFALSELGTHDKVLNSKSGYLCYKTTEFLEISADGNNWFYLKNLTEETVKLSFYGEILPLLYKNGVDLTPLTDGFTLYGRITTASENHNAKSPKNVFCYKKSEAFTFDAPSFCFIHVILPEGTETDLQITEYFPFPTEEDIILPDGLNVGKISKEGFIFYGWSLDGETRINKIPAGTKTATLYSHWNAREYKINYDAKNGHSFTFGTIKNPNPKSYTAGTEVVITDLQSPIGYMFGGWYLDEKCEGEKFTKITSDMTGDIILYAKWTTALELQEQTQAQREQIIKERMYGDINSDGKITAADARLVLRHVVELEIQPDEIIQRVNYYGTAKITSENARTTLRIAVELENLTDILLEYKIIE